MASRSWNRAELIGNLTRDPELRYTPTGAAVCTLGIATNRTYVSDGEKKEEVDFHRLVAWNKLAELCSQLLKKGNRVFISGRLQNRSWEGQDGQTRNVTEIVIEDMILLTPRANGEVYVGDPTLSAIAATDDTVADNATVADAAVEASTPDEKTAPAKATGVKEEKESIESDSESSDKEKSPKTTPKEEVDESDLPF